MVLSVEDDNLAMILEWKAQGMKHFKLRPHYLCYTGWLMHGQERFLVENFKVNFRSMSSVLLGKSRDPRHEGRLTLKMTFTERRELFEGSPRTSCKSKYSV